MIYEVTITEQANADLRGIYEYIAFELLSPDNAVGQLDRLEESILKLKEFPNRFQSYEKEPWHSRGLRVMPVDNFIVLYISDKENATVIIIRVMYGGRNAEEQLNKFTLYNN